MFFAGNCSIEELCGVRALEGFHETIKKHNQSEVVTKCVVDLKLRTRCPEMTITQMINLLLYK